MLHERVDGALRDLAARCRETGMRMTPQRLAVYRAVRGTQGHPSPEEVFLHVKVEMPSLSLGTVYKTLDTLEDLGLVTRVPNLGDTKRYDANTEQHHHLVCTHCNRIIDYADSAFDALRPTLPLQGFEPQNITVQVFGTCEACRAKSDIAS